MKLRILPAEAVRQALPMAEAIAAMKAAFAQLSTGQAVTPLRARLDVAPHEGVTLAMPAYLSGSEALAVKVVSVFPQNAARREPTIYGLVMVLAAESGRPLAILEGGTLTAIRTGAASGAATDLLARPDAAIVAILGSGVQARTQLEAVCTARNIQEARVYSPNREHAARFARQMQGAGPIPDLVRVMDSPAAAVRGADIICAATTSSTPVFAGADLKPGAHVNGVGSFTPAMQEVDAETVRRALVVVDSVEAALEEAGDLIIPIEQGHITRQHIYAELGEIAAGRKPGRATPEQITFFKSVGVAAQDAAAGQLALQNARKRNLGVQLLLLLLLFLFSPVTLARAQPAVTSNTAVPDYPQSVTFTLELAEGSNVVDAELTYAVEQISCLPAAASVPVELDGNRAEWTWEMVRSGNPPPGASMWWEWTLTTADGQTITTPRQELTFTDDRFNWRALQEGKISLHWYKGEEVGPVLLDAAVAGLQTLENDMGITLDQPAQLFIYGDSADMRDAVLYIQDWAGGVAFSEYNIILIGVPPNIADDWGVTTVRHELAHLVVGQYGRSCVGGSRPTWLNEGLAVYAEGDPANILRDLEPALANNSFDPLRSLNGSFPAGDMAAGIAYAQSYSVVDFMLSEYGPEKMQSLLQLLAQGEEYDTALEQVYGFNVDGLELAWRAQMGLPPRDIPPTPTPILAANIPTLEPQSAPQTVPTPAAAAATAAPAANPPAPAATGVCGLGLVPLFLAGFFFNRKAKRQKRPPSRPRPRFSDSDYPGEKMNQQVDKSIHRQLVNWKTADPPDTCPQCGATLVQDPGPYLVETHSGFHLMDKFAANGTFGYLCPECPTAVIHLPDLVDMLNTASFSFPSTWEVGTEYAVVGIFNLDAIPPEKEDASFEEIASDALVTFRREKIPVNTGIKRTLHFFSGKEAPENCPKCDETLFLDYGPYLALEIYNNGDEQEVVVEGPFGYLCPACPTAVIHLPALVENVASGTGKNRFSLTILGRFNVESLPLEKLSDSFSDLSLDIFVPYRHTRRPYRRRKKRPYKPKPKRKRKKGRK